MSVWNWLGNWARRADVERVRIDLERKLLEEQRLMAEARKNEWDTTLKTGLRVIGGAGSGSASSLGNARIDEQLTDDNLTALRKNALDMSLFNPTFRACLRSLVKFVVGKGFTFSMAAPDPDTADSPDWQALAAKSLAYWRTWWRANRLGRKEKELGRRYFRDGEVIWTFEGKDSGRPAAKVERQDDGTEVAVPIFRFLSPDTIRDPSGTHAYGIHVDEDDPETVLGYLYSADGITGREIDPRWIVHWKAEADSDWKRGITPLVAVVQIARKIARFTDAAIDRVEIQNAWVMVKRYANSTAATTARNTHLRSGTATDDDYEQKRLKGGTTVTLPKGTEVEMMGPKMEGSRADDARLLFLLAASGADIAEYMASGDASNANYSSQMVSESPAVRSFEYYQDALSEEWVDVGRRVIRWGKELGALPDNAPEELDVQPPPLVARNEVEQTQALERDHSFGVSRRTILQKRGYDPDQEEKLRKEELAASAGPEEEARQREEDGKQGLAAALAKAMKGEPKAKDEEEDEGTPDA